MTRQLQLRKHIEKTGDQTRANTIKLFKLLTGPTTLSTTIPSIKTISIMTFSIMKLSITLQILSWITFDAHAECWMLNEYYWMSYMLSVAIKSIILSAIMLIVVILSVIMLSFIFVLSVVYAECHLCWLSYSECYYGEFHCSGNAECRRIWRNFVVS